MAPQGPAYHDDWILSNTSNAHVTNHRDWFTTFVEFPSYITPPITTQDNIAVAGIGTVILPTRTRRKPQQITLKNVLYAPGGVCNIFAYRMQPEYIVESTMKTATIKDRSGKVVGLTAVGSLCRIWLKGQPEKHTSLDPANVYWIRADWPATERARWEEHIGVRPPGTSATVDRGIVSLPSLTDAEKSFLKEKFGNEFKFLQQYGLRMYDGEQRAEGRDILRGLMTIGDSSDEDDDSESGYDDGDRFLRDLEEDPMSHVADYHFSEKQLRWISKHYRHSGQFMLSYGLKPFDDGDCKEAIEYLSGLMEP